jgi:dienelactone hydrolase
VDLAMSLFISLRRFWVIGFLAGYSLLSGSTTVAFAAEAPYDPTTAIFDKFETHELVVEDSDRRRQIGLKVYAPATGKPEPVILFSHGLGGTKDGAKYLGEHWAKRGYIAVFMQHPGSDAAVWTDKPQGERMAALRNAASPQNFRDRVSDLKVTLDQIVAWNKDQNHHLANRCQIDEIGMSGHSFGAITTQAVSGQVFPIGRGLADRRIKAATLLSPSPPRRGADPQTAFGSVSIPWLLMTGTADSIPFTDLQPSERLKVFPPLPKGQKYELVLHNAEHSAFGMRPLPNETHPHNPNHHPAIQAISTAFWDSTLRHDERARKWLESDEARTVLEANDHWQFK